MNFFSRNSAVLTISLLLILAAILLGARIIVLDGFIHIEAEDAKEHIERVAAALNYETSLVDSACTDFSASDDTYRFIKDGNADFIKLNLTDAVLSKLKIDFVSIILLDGEEIFSKTIDNKSKSFEPYKALKPYLFDGAALVSVEGGVKGLLVAGDTAVIISSRPIRTSEGKGPVSGVLIMGRMLDNEEMMHLSALTRIPLTMRLYKSPSQEQSAEPKIKIQRPDLDSLNVSYLFKDINTKPIFTLSAKIDRKIYQEGVKTVRNFMLSTFAGVLLAMLAISRLTGRLTESEWNRLVTETLYNAVVEKSPAAALLMDAVTCRIIKTTPEMSKLLGYPPEHLQGVLFRELLHESIAEFEKCRNVAFESGSSVSATELSLVRSDRAVISAVAETSLKIRGGKRLLLLYLQNSEKESEKTNHAET